VELGPTSYDLVGELKQKLAVFRIKLNSSRYARSQHVTIRGCGSCLCYTHWNFYNF